MQDPEKYLPKIVSRVHKGETVTVHGQPDKVGSRMYIDCRNLADAWLFMLREVDFNRYGEDIRMTKFNIAGLEEITNLELAERIADRMKKDLKYEFVDFHKTRAGHDLRYALDSSKIYDAGWRPPIELEETFDQVIDHVRRHEAWQE
jgi:dTDP-glucose 4,6-dehydratase